MTLNEDECAAAGIDPKKIASIARRIERAAVEARALGVQVFGGSGSASLRFDDGERHMLILANIDGNWSGGCGAEMSDAAGLMRGE
jgi:hypothetical protein